MARAVKAVNRILTYAVYVLYPAMLIWILLTEWQRSGLTDAVIAFLPYLLVPGISFVLVTAVRDRLDAPRPYEAWDIDPLIHKDTKGHSMPSRHVFSSTVIAMCALRLQVGFGIVMLLISAFLAAVRVLGGVHYPKDVAAGYAVGVLAGLLLFLF